MPDIYQVLQATSPTVDLGKDYTYYYGSQFHAIEHVNVYQDEQNVLRYKVSTVEISFAVHVG